MNDVLYLGVPVCRDRRIVKRNVELKVASNN